MVAAAEVEPLHAGDVLAELRLEDLHDPLKRIRPLLAHRVKVQA